MHREDALGLPHYVRGAAKTGLETRGVRADLEYLVVDKGDKNPTGN